MKLFKYIMMAVITILYGCDPDRVDVLPTNPTELDFFSTTEEFRESTYGVYVDLIDFYAMSNEDMGSGARGIYDITRIPSDDISTSNGNRSQLELFDGQLNANYNRTQSYWVHSWQIIQKSNVVIEKVSEVDWAEYEGASEIPMMEGEALFMRAYAHFNLMRLFGDVPLVVKRIITQAESNPPRESAEVVLDQVISDLQTAITQLPESWSPEFVGRATKNSARSLLVKALVTRANYYGSTGDYSEAVNVFNNITNTLIADYSNNFNAFDENNAESAFEIQASQPNSARGGNAFLHNSGPWRGVELMEIFRGNDMDPDNTPGAESGWMSQTKHIATQKLLNVGGSDPRIAFWLSPIPQGVIIEKYTKPGYNVQSDRHQQSQNNERILRYADVKLFAAEAALKSGQPGVAIGHINDVRARANAWGATLVAGTDYDDTITPALTLPAPRNTGETNNATIMGWVMEERFIELASEGHRWFDLLRWHKSGDIDLSTWDGGDTGFSSFLVSGGSEFQFDADIHTLFPIPQIELDRNENILENNFGY